MTLIEYYEQNHNDSDFFKKLFIAFVSNDEDLHSIIEYDDEGLYSLIDYFEEKNITIPPLLMACHYIDTANLQHLEPEDWLLAIEHADEHCSLILITQLHKMKHNIRMNVVEWANNNLKSTFTNILFMHFKSFQCYNEFFQFAPLVQAFTNFYEKDPLMTFFYLSNDYVIPKETLDVIIHHPKHFQVVHRSILDQIYHHMDTFSLNFVHFFYNIYTQHSIDTPNPFTKFYDEMNTIHQMKEALNISIEEAYDIFFDTQQEPQKEIDLVIS